ncbi:MAG: hypothetical protein ABI356_15555 [Steroidobacteraceae bacterium]
MPRIFDDAAECVESAVRHSQRHYISGNYTHVARAVAGQGVLERMSLNAPKTRQEWLWQRLLVRELGDIV